MTWVAEEVTPEIEARMTGIGVRTELKIPILPLMTVPPMAWLEPAEEAGGNLQMAEEASTQVETMT